MSLDKPRLSIQSGQVPQTSEYLRPPPPSDDRGGYQYGQSAPIAPLNSAQQKAARVLSAITNPMQYLPEAFPDSPLLAQNQPGYGVRPTPFLPEGDALAAGTDMQQAGMDNGQIPYMSAGGSADPSFEQYLASRGLGGGGGGGAAAPDYSQYRAALTDQAGQVNSQIQAMYNQLAESAGENVTRLGDIYGGASGGINAGYDAATANIADAYGSAQQQASDQMARLGIEDAAGQVLPSQALAQAQAISSLEQGRGSGLAATERYGASAGGFGSQMAQVAQQEGTEMNSAILASLQNRLNDSLAAEQAGASSGGGGGGMSVRDQLALREAYNRDVGGQLPLDERRFAFDVAQAAARPTNEFSEWKRNTFLELTLPQNGQKPIYTPDQATDYINNVELALG